jgi:hypothetical protein
MALTRGPNAAASFSLILKEGILTNERFFYGGRELTPKILTSMRIQLDSGADGRKSSLS